MRYGYARVSSKDQVLDRQIEQLKQWVNDPDRDIITDEQTGKNFERPGYKLLVGTDKSASLLRRGDELVICSVDRLGRNASELKSEWERLTKQMGVTIRVLDMPLLNPTSDAPEQQLIADIILQLLCYFAEKERVENHKRQRQGYDAMPVNADGKRYSTKTGRTCGKPPIEYPSNWGAVYQRWRAGEITAVQAMRETNLKHSSYYNLVNRYEGKKKK